MFVHVFPQDESAASQAISIPVIHRLTRAWNNPSWHHPLHAHRDYVELMFFAEGEAEITAGRHKFHCVPGDMVLIDKNIIHSTASVEGHPRDTWCCQLSHVELPGQAQGHYILRCSSGEYANYILETFHQIFAFSRRNDRITDRVCNELVGTMLTIFQEQLRRSPMLERDEELSFAQQILIYLNDHFAQRITLDSLARAFLTSRSRVSSEFKKEYETSPINYLIDKRLTESIWLLVNTTTPVHQIAQAVGYENPYYFIKLFTARMGLSPAAYRERHNAAPSPERETR